MKEGWKLKPFEKCLEKVVYTTKLQGKDYLKDGLYPIVSQEECMISGYWNRTEDVFHIKKPIVVFGDHTRIVKYIDFDFVLGADGVKILCPIDELDAKFLSYYLIWYKIPNLGYSRHYKILKEIEIPVPPLSEQHQIVEELDLLTSIIEKKKEQLKELDNLAQSIFYDMFGDPVTNEKGWEIKKIEDVAFLNKGITYKPTDVSNEGIIVLRSSNIKNNEFDLSDIVRISAQIKEEKLVNKGDILMCNRNGSAKLVGKVAKIPELKEQMTFGTFMTVIQSNMNNYLFYFFQTYAFRKQIQFQTAVAINQISLPLLASVDVPVPPLPLQQSFASKIEAIEKQKALIKQSITEAETLFNSRMDYYFG